MTQFDVETYRSEIKQLGDERLQFLLEQIGRNGETSVGAVCRQEIEAELKARLDAGVALYKEGGQHHAV